MGENTTKSKVTKSSTGGCGGCMRGKRPFLSGETSPKHQQSW